MSRKRTKQELGFHMATTVGFGRIPYHHTLNKCYHLPQIKKNVHKIKENVHTSTKRK